MADAPAGTKGKGLGFLTQKAGPLPLWGWLAIGGGLWWYFEKQKSSTAAAATTQVTDPAGNVCTALDPATGFCPGTPQDQAAQLALSSPSNNAGTGATDTSGADGSGSPGGGPSPVPTPITVPPVTTTVPPTGPTAPPPGKTPPNPTWSYPAPGGLQAYNVTSKGYQLKWNAVTGPGGARPSSYTVQTVKGAAQGQPASAVVDQNDTPNLTFSEYGKGGGGLAAGTYHTNVWANGGPQGPPHASITVTLKG